MSKKTSIIDVMQTLSVEGRSYTYYSLANAHDAFGDVQRSPRTLKILIENVLRSLRDPAAAFETANAIARSPFEAAQSQSIEFWPTRILSQDLAGVPLIADLAGLREAVALGGGAPDRVNPVIPVDFVVDHSIVVDHFGTPESLKQNASIEIQRNRERFEFLRWAQTAFRNFRLVPPGKGICHQINLEYFSTVIATNRGPNGQSFAYPDTLVGTDSHTTMVNGIGVLGWGVGGIEAEMAMLGQPISMLIPDVVGVRLTGELREGLLATDLVLSITEILRREGVVGKLVEFFGPGVARLAATDRATIANMAPDYGATCGYFGIDRETIRYLQLTGRKSHDIALVEAYAKVQGLWIEPDLPEPKFAQTIEIDLSQIETCVAGPRRPQDRVGLARVASGFAHDLTAARGNRSAPPGTHAAIRDGDVVIAAITSCTNTSNPHAMIASGLLAKKARAHGLKPKPYVKTSFAPGSQVVSDYLAASGLQADLDALGFNVVGYGCTTCIGNAGPIGDKIAAEIASKDLTTVAVLSGNRNFEGRVSPQAKAAYLASPPLVIAYALAGSILVDLTREPIGSDAQGTNVYLKDIWPTADEIEHFFRTFVTARSFSERYRHIFEGGEQWEALESPAGQLYAWSPTSTFISRPPYFDAQQSAGTEAIAARVLLVVGDSFTTDHISPAGSISENSPAAKFLSACGVAIEDYGTYGARRGNHHVMVRGTFANTRIRNALLPGVEGGLTRHMPSGEIMAVFDAASRYETTGTPLVIIAGKEYGTGSSRDWAAKGTALLGVRAVIAESFERIHRANLVGMAVLPLQLKRTADRAQLALDGSETIVIPALSDLRPNQELEIRVCSVERGETPVSVVVRIDTETELDQFRSGGMLRSALANFLSA